MRFQPQAQFGEIQFQEAPRFAGIIQPFRNDPMAGNLATPINNSDLALRWVNNLPIYRSGLSPVTRGLEIGMAHGYLLLGPFLKLGPLRQTDQALLAGFSSASALVLILSLCLYVYGVAMFQRRGPAGILPGNLQDYRSWNLFSSGFLVGGLGGVIFASFILLEVARAGIS
nr:photosystem I reaction center subunit XI [Petrachloros mirabilis]